MGTVNPRCISCSGYGKIDNWQCPRCKGTGHNPYAIHWVICGGESGKDARPMHPNWARSLRRQCNDAGIPFFFKQWGEWKPNEIGESAIYETGTFIDKAGEWGNNPVGSFVRILGMNWGTAMSKSGKKKSGRLLDGREWNEFPIPVKESVGADDPDLYSGGFDY